MLNMLKPSRKIFYLPFQGGASFVDHLCYFCLVLLCFHARLFVDALWSSAAKGLTSWLSFVMPNCDVVTFPLVSLVMFGAWLYRFLIFVIFLALLLPLSIVCGVLCFSPCFVIQYVMFVLVLQSS